MKKILVAVISIFLLSMSAGIVGAGSKDRVLDVGVTMSTTIENPWNRAFLVAIDKAKAMGYKFEYNYVERCNKENIGRAMSTFAERGVDILFEHSSSGYDDLLGGIHKTFPNVVFVGGGTSYKEIPPNVGWYDARCHEAVYLCGVLAGMMTKTNVLGFVSSFPVPKMFELFNAYKAGALSINPNIKVKLTWLNTWYDPAKGKEATLAQMAVGADYIFAEKTGVFQAAQTKEGVYAFGIHIDDHETAPEVVVTSALVDWSATITKVMDRVLAGNFEAKEYTYGMREGGADIAPFFGFEEKLPQEVKNKVMEIRAKIKDGTMVIPGDRSKAIGD